MIDKAFEKWALGFSGCDGGTIGSPDNNSIWFCGIEWGGNFNKDELNGIFNVDVSQPPLGYEDYIDEHNKPHEAWEENLSYIFNWQAMKILSVIAGKELSEYKDFAKEYKPFINNSHTNYFKMNLYPIAFKNTSHKYWQEHYVENTKLQTKDEYINWIKNNRFPIMRNWVREYSPKLILCVGISYFEDFRKAFMISDTSVNTEIIDDKQLNWFKNENKTLVAVVPFMINRNGLTKNKSIKNFGMRISDLM